MLNSSALGFDKLWNDSQMFFAMLRRQFVLLLIIKIIGLSVFIFAIKPKGIGGETGLCIYKTYLQTLITQTFDYKPKLNCGDYVGFVSIRDFSTGGFYGEFIKMCNIFLLNSLLWSCLIYLIIPLWMLLSHFQNKGDLKDKILRGVGMIEPTEIKNFIKKNPILFKGYMFKLTDNIYLPESIATRGSLTIGKPGSGKSQLIYRMIEQLRERKSKSIIHDFKGDMISSFYNEDTDIIFNPVDERMVPWSLFKELENIIDVQAFCSSIIAKNDKDPFWSDSAENLLRSILILCIHRNEKNYDSLWEYINTPNKELKKLLDETPNCSSGSKVLADDKIAANVMAVLAASVQALEYLGMSGLDRFEIKKEDAPEEMQSIDFKGFFRVNDSLSYYKILVKNIGGRVVQEEYYQYYQMSEMFSISEWVRGEGKFKNRQFIFLSNQAKVQKAVKSFLTMFIEFSVTALCSLPDSQKRKLYFILDEFGQLSKMDKIVMLLTQGRSKGGATWILVQDFAQIKEIYGNEGANIIINNCGNLSFFAVNDETTAQILSKSIGSVEIKRTDSSRSMSWHDARDSFSQSEKIQENALILPKEIMDLPTLTFVIKMVDMPTTKDRFNHKEYDTSVPSFIPFAILKSKKEEPKVEVAENKPQTIQSTAEPKKSASKLEELDGDIMSVLSIKERQNYTMAYNQEFYRNSAKFEEEKYVSPVSESGEKKSDNTSLDEIV